MKPKGGVVLMTALEPRILLSAPELVKDLDPTTASAFTDSGGSAKHRMLMIGNRAYFTANSSPADENGLELWTSDGTAEGTHMVRDVVPGPAGMWKRDVVSFGSGVIFSVSTTSGITTPARHETWRSDGIEAGTFRLGDDSLTMDVTGSTRLGSLIVGNLKNQFAGSPGLGVTDGTTVTILKSYTGEDLHGAHGFVTVGGLVYFQGYHPATGTELWRTDGTATGTYRVADINLGTASASPEIYSIGGKAFLFADDGQHGREWWITDGSASGTRLIKDMNVGASHLNARYARAVNGKLIFEVVTLSGAVEVYTSDGTADGTQRVTIPNLSLSNSVSAGSLLYFEGGGRALFATDGVSWQKLTDFGLYPSDLTTFGSRVVFCGETSTHGREPWISDGTVAGTYMLRDIAPGAALWSSPFLFAQNAAESLTFFAADAKDGHGNELWVTDGTQAGTRRVANVNQTTPSSWPTAISRVGDTILFSAQGVTAVNGLWKTDGTAAGTSFVAPVTTSPGSSRDEFPYSVINGKLFFRGFAAGSGNGDAYVSDGTPAGTRRIAPNAAGSSQYGFTRAGAEVFFFASTAGGHAIYRTNLDGNGATLAAAGPVKEFAYAAWRDSLYFARGQELWALNGSQSAEKIVTLDKPISRIFNVRDRILIVAGTTLYHSDGTAAGTELITTITNVTTGVANVIPVNGGAIFSASKLWFTDFTAAGTKQITLDRSVDSIVSFGDSAYFVAYESPAALGPGGLYRFDAALQMAVLIKEVRSPYNLSAAGGGLYFRAYEPETGRELWSSDGTPGGTRRVADLAPGAYHSDPSGVTELNGKIYFSANDNARYGAELWAIPDEFAPAALGATYDFAGSPPAVVLRFTENIWPSLRVEDLLLENTTTGLIVPAASIAIQYDAATNVARLTAAPGQAWPDGRYRLTLAAGSIRDAAGNVSTAALEISFYVLAGDLNRDGQVTFTDLLTVAANFGKSPAVFSDGDLNGDGQVGFTDLIGVAAKFGTSLTSPTTPAAAASKSVNAALFWQTSAIARPVRKAPAKRITA